jgi:hypothetical protein
LFLLSNSHFVLFSPDFPLNCTKQNILASLFPFPPLASTSAAPFQPKDQARNHQSCGPEREHRQAGRTTDNYQLMDNSGATGSIAGIFLLVTDPPLFN